MNSSTMSDLPVLHEVVHVLLVERVRLQQLVDDVELLALDGVVGLDLLRWASTRCSRRQLRVLLDLVDGLGNVRAP